MKCESHHCDWISLFDDTFTYFYYFLLIMADHPADIDDAKLIIPFTPNDCFLSNNWLSSIIPFAPTFLLFPIERLVTFACVCVCQCPIYVLGPNLLTVSTWQHLHQNDISHFFYLVTIRRTIRCLRWWWWMWLDGCFHSLPRDSAYSFRLRSHEP